MQAVNGRTTVYGIIGKPVAHSFSPLIHNTLAREMGLDMVYVPFPVEEPERIGDAVRGAWSMGVRGLNVTVPYKSAVIPYLSETDRVAAAIGAVNTLVWEDSSGPTHFQPYSPGNKGYKGYNTDYSGLRRALEEMGLVPARMDVVLIGAGGAARAAGFMAGEAGVPHLTVLNRTVEKALSLSDEVRELFPGTKTRAMPLEKAVKAVRDGWNTNPVLAIQCTNVGLAPAAGAVPVEDPDFYQSIAAAFDCIYNPEETRFLALARAAGCEGRNGMDMLLYQGIEAFTIWTGQKPDRQLTEKAAGLLRQAARA